MSRRTQQVGHTIRRELSELIFRHVSDPRIHGIISVTDVKVTADLTRARVLISVMGTEEEKTEIFEGLGTASGFLRRELASRIKLRRIPELIFERDDSIERADHLLKLIDQISHE